MSETDATTKPAEAVQQPPVEDGPEAVTTEVANAEVENPETSKPDADKSEAAKEEKTEDAPSKDASILKTKAKIDREDYRNNNKFDPSIREVTDDPVAIRKQVEFYFGDWNFPQDKFMWESCEGPENKPIPIEKIHSFKRMRIFQPYTAVVAALRDSTVLDVSGEEGKELVNRKVAYKPQATSKAKTEASTVYVKGFGDEDPDTQFDLESFFTTFGEVKGLKLRRTNEGLFKGSVFVTFVDEDIAKKFLELDPAPKWKEHDLKIMSKHDYCEEKSELIRQGKLEPNTTTARKFYEGKDYSSGKGGNRGRGGRDGRGPRDSNDWKQRRDQDQKSGFRGGRGRGGRDRGGRGRGRGGRGGRDNRDRDHRDNRDRRDDGEAKHSANNTTPRIQATDDGEKTAAATSNGKRARDDDAPADSQPAAKKVDTKSEAS